MPAGRPDIPAQIKRDVLVEAGHRCAIPRCQATPVELAHIEPWSKVQTHTFENLIALCPTCHTRFDSGQIDKLAMKQYKANLSVLSGRYGETERRILGWFADHPAQETTWLAGDHTLHLMYLLKDGLLERTSRPIQPAVSGIPLGQEYRITEAGRAFVARWIAAEPV